MPWGDYCLNFNFDLIWLENEELQDNERKRFSKWQQRQRLVTAKRHVMLRAIVFWHGEQQVILQNIVFQMKNFLYII